MNKSGSRMKTLYAVKYTKTALKPCERVKKNSLKNERLFKNNFHYLFIILFSFTRHRIHSTVPHCTENFNP